MRCAWVQGAGIALGQLPVYQSSWALCIPRTLWCSEQGAVAHVAPFINVTYLHKRRRCVTPICLICAASACLGRIAPAMTFVADRPGVQDIEDIEDIESPLPLFGTLVADPTAILWALQLDLNRPMSEIRAQLSLLPTRTRLILTGTLVVARDIAHAKLQVGTGEIILGDVQGKTRTVGKAATDQSVSEIGFDDEILSGPGLGARKLSQPRKGKPRSAYAEQNQPEFWMPC